MDIKSDIKSDTDETSQDLRLKLALTYECQTCKKVFQLSIETEDLSQQLDDHLFAKHKCYMPKIRIWNGHEIKEVGIGHLISYETMD